MPESQNIEYKQSWHDDYLKWVYGFANGRICQVFRTINLTLLNYNYLCN